MSENRSQQAAPNPGAASPRSLAECIEMHTPSGSVGNVTCWCDDRFASFSAHAEHVAAVWREACTIRTVVELDAQRSQCVVRDLDGQLFEKTGAGWDCLAEDGSGGLLRSTAVRTPALLLWHPDWEAS